MADVDHIEHVAVVGRPSQHADERVTVVFDGETGRKIGHPPNYRVEQVKCSKRDGTITTTLKITHVRDV